MKEDKSLRIINPDIDMLEMQSEIIGINEDNFERDKNTILEMYKSEYTKYKDRANIPLFSDIENSVLAYNYDKCYEISVIEFETFDKAEVMNTFYSSAYCSTMDINDRIQAILDQKTGNMMNDIGWSHSEAIRMCIRNSLNELGVIYEDNDPCNPFLRNIFADFNIFRIVANNAQIVMFPDIHRQEYMYDADLINDTLDDITNYVIERRTQSAIKDRLLGSGGDKNVPK